MKRIPGWIILLLILLVFSWLLLAQDSSNPNDGIEVSNLHLCIEQSGGWRIVSSYSSNNQDKYVCGTVALNHRAPIDLTISIYKEHVFAFQPLEWRYFHVVNGPFQIDIPDDLPVGDYKVVVGTARRDFSTYRFAVEK